MSETPWTKLEGSELWRLAEDRHKEPFGRHYHNMNHVRRLYRHAAETFDMPYCPILDRAILGHDVIVDGRPDEVSRSADWLESIDPSHASSRGLIMSTKDHAPGEDNRMILLDLADFMFPAVSIENTDLLEMEARDLHGRSKAIFISGTSSYLKGLMGRIEAGLMSCPITADRDNFIRICAGIDRTLARLDYKALTGDEQEMSGP